MIYLFECSLDKTQVDRPQNGVKSHILPGSNVAQRVDAKHIPGKSEKRAKTKHFSFIFVINFFFFLKPFRFLNQPLYMVNYNLQSFLHTTKRRKKITAFINVYFFFFFIHLKFEREKVKLTAAFTTLLKRIIFK